MKTLSRLGFLIGIPFLPLAALTARADMRITASEGFTLTWDGNEADHFSEEETAPVPTNLATAAGAAAFTSSDLGPLLNIPFHVAANLNDGLYGNSNSWIGGNAPNAFAGISLGGLTTLSSFAIGRDNGNNVTDPQEVFLGQLTDRCLGIYTVQITRVSFPDGTTPDTGDAATGWQTVGTLDYAANDDTVPGELFTAFYRHQFAITQGAGSTGVQATALRILVPATGIGEGTDIDEIELYGPATVTLDKDGDGFDDTVETALGFDPGNPASTPEGNAVIETAVEFSFYAANGKTYTIQESEDMTAWVPVEENVRGKGVKISRVYSKAGKTKRYYRAVRIDA
ncbi:MAG: hypothetical protein JWM59_1474 [Verrucomicrobiales bacterium]|nr:hypothetical protein [Verrucomicrobiales bacterium]